MSHQCHRRPSANPGLRLIVGIPKFQRSSKIPQMLSWLSAGSGVMLCCLVGLETSQQSGCEMLVAIQITVREAEEAKWADPSDPPKEGPLFLQDSVLARKIPIANCQVATCSSEHPELPFHNLTVRLLASTRLALMISSLSFSRLHCCVAGSEEAQWWYICASIRLSLWSHFHTQNLELSTRNLNSTSSR